MTFSTRTDFQPCLEATDDVSSQPASRSDTYVAENGLENSEDELALKFAAKHETELKFTAEWGRWSVWSGVRWRRDTTLHVFDLVRRVCRRASANCADKKIAAKLASAATVAAVERLARADRRHAMTVDQWDADDFLLNTPTGVVDLHDGSVQANAQSHYFTKSTAAGPGGNCSRWLEFLDQITDGNRDLLLFLQRAFGYALTGSTREQCFFFLYGTGANGKTVLLSTITSILADYAKTAPIQTFTQCTGDQHPTDLAALRGARLVASVETEDGRRWAESRLKAMTGGDRISARFMRGNFFEYAPKFKIFVTGNRQPSLQEVDEAMRRRLYVVPFTVTIPAAERDPELFVKLRAEWPGILQWLIEGCVEWQRTGLKPAAAVKASTSAYFLSEDSIGSWLHDCCDSGALQESTTDALFKSWQSWCHRSGEQPGSEKRFSQRLEAKGFARTRIGCKQLRGFHGIMLRVEAATGR